MILRQEQLDSFWKNGYLSYKKVIDDEQLEILRREYDTEFKKTPPKGLSLQEIGNAEEDEPIQVVFQLMQMSERNIHFSRLIYNPDILDAMEDIIGPNIQLFHDQGLFKPPHTGGPIPWHQDNGYWRCRPASLVSCWLTLDDVDIDNGAMQFIPQSHLTPLWHDQQNSSLHEIDVFDKSQAVVVDLPAGGCLFHHCQTLHYTAPNTTDRQRRAFAIHYMVPGTVKYMENPKTKKMETLPLPVGFNNPLLRARI